MNTTHRIIFTIIALALSFSAFAQNAYDKNGKQHGKWERYDNQGHLQYKGQFYHGVPRDTFYYYYPNQSIKSIAIHNNKGKTYATTYYENGNIASIGKFVNKQKDSTWNYYNEDGKLILKESYQKDKKNGASQTFNPDNGQLVVEIIYQNDHKNGITTTYYDDGTLYSKTTYKNDSLQGLAEWQYPDGTIFTRGNYANNLKHGNWIEFNTKGQPQTLATYEKGKVTTKYVYLTIDHNLKRIEEKDIAYFYTNQEQTYMVKFDKTTTKIDETLPQLQHLCTNDDFVRATENIYASFKAIRNAKPLNQNAIELFLTPKTTFRVIAKDQYNKLIRGYISTLAPKLEEE